MKIGSQVLIKTVKPDRQWADVFYVDAGRKEVYLNNLLFENKCDVKNSALQADLVV